MMRSTSCSAWTFRTITSSDPAVAVQIASTQPIDVLCADYAMPTMNGLELVESLARKNDVIAAVLITGQIEAYLQSPPHAPIRSKAQSWLTDRRERD